MRKLPEPSIDFPTAFAEALKGVTDLSLRGAYSTQITNAADIEKNYIDAARNAQLFNLPRTSSSKKDDPVVHGTLKKSQPTSLYTDYFVPRRKPARKLYDAIKVTANGKCPLCGDVGQVRTLDHFAPKANFPLYSIVPSNLLPCCRDCNSGKMNEFADTLDRQTLHPYFDNDKYFSEKWVDARIIPGNPFVLEYFVSPPNSWADSEKKRVAAHFEVYELAEKFSVEAGADIPETLAVRKTILANLPPDQYAAYLLEKSVNLGLPINNWRRVMFLCFANSHWFCSHKH